MIENAIEENDKTQTESEIIQEIDNMEIKTQNYLELKKVSELTKGIEASIVDYETILKRSQETLYTVNLVKIGTFWRAYEFSAYLMYQYNASIGGILKMNPNHRYNKNGDDGTSIYIGFPTTSYKKYTKGLKICDVSDNCKLIDLKEILGDNINLDNYEEKVKEWKNGVKIKVNNEDNKDKWENKKDDDTSSVNAVKEKYNITNNAIYESQDKQLDLSKRMSLHDIIRKIMLYPVNEKSIIDNTNFIYELKMDISNITF